MSEGALRIGEVFWQQSLCLCLEGQKPATLGMHLSSPAPSQLTTYCARAAYASSPFCTQQTNTQAPLSCAHIYVAHSPMYVPLQHAAPP